MTKRLVLLVLLTSLHGASAGSVEEPCCDWAEGAEWPLEAAAHCPASLDGAVASYCCGLCYASPLCPLEGAWPDREECPADDLHEYPEQLGAISGSAPNAHLWESALVLVLPAIFLVVFFCMWLCLNYDDERLPRGSAPSVLRSQLQTHPPLRYGTCSADTPLDASMESLVPQDSPSPSLKTNVSFQRPNSEMLGEKEGASIFPPGSILEEPLPGDAPESLPGGAPEPLPGGAPEPLPGDAPEPLPGDAPEPLPGDAPEPLPGDAPEPLPGDAPEPLPGDAPEPLPGDAPEPLPGDAPEPLPGGAPEPLPGGAPEPLPGGAPEPLPGGAPEPLPGGAPLPPPQGAQADLKADLE